MKKAITHCLIKFGIDHLVYFTRIGDGRLWGGVSAQELMGAELLIMFVLTLSGVFLHISVL